MPLPLLYLETSVVSYLAARPSRDVITFGRQQITESWWEQDRDQYNIVISLLVLNEAGAGDKFAANRRLQYLEGLRLLETTDEVMGLADLLVNEGTVPDSAYADAVHIAVCSIHEVNYLLTWNCRHINNPHTRRQIGRICRSQGFEPPVICSPDELVEE